MGDMENRKYESINYKTKKLVRVPKEKHIVVENTHEPLVSRDDFNVVQRLMSARHTPPRHDYANIFKSIIYCMECGGRMNIAAKEIRTYDGFITRTSYRCMRHCNQPDRCLHYHSIYYDDLLEIVVTKLKELFALMRDDDKLLELIQRRSSVDTEAERINDDKQKITKRLDALDKIIRKMYEDFAAEIIDAASYNRLMKDYFTEQKGLNARLAELNKIEINENRFGHDLEKLREYVTLYMTDGHISREMINQLIERIEVSHLIRENGEKRREVKIAYRFVGEL